MVNCCYVPIIISSEPPLRPTEIKDAIAIFFPPSATADDIIASSYGRWLVGEPLHKLDDTWQRIKEEMEANRLFATGLKCSTGGYNPSSSGTGPVTNGVISIYTTEEDIDNAGFEIIKIVEHDIQYKTNEMSASGQYRHKGNRKIILKSLFWNKGNYQFFNLIKRNRSVWKGKAEDTWHLNVARSSESCELQDDQTAGYWCAESELENLTDLWHYMRKLIVKDELGPVMMECPKEQKKKGSGIPLLLVFTAQQNMKNVGSALKSSNLVKSLSYIDSSRSLKHSNTG